MIPTVAYNDTPESDIIHQPYTAFSQGVEAFQLGHKMRDNPYREETREREFWDSGWRLEYLEYLGVYDS